MTPIAAALALHSWSNRVCRPGHALSRAEVAELAAIERSLRAAALSSGGSEAAPLDLLELAFLACAAAEIPVRAILNRSYRGFDLTTYVGGER